MTTAIIPRHLDLRQLASRDATVKGQLCLSQMPRLAAAVAGAEHCAEVSIRCRRDEEGRFIANCLVDMPVVQTCQRCLGMVALDLKSESSLAVVWNDEQAKGLPKQYDPLIAGEDADLWAVVEEELLLVLPVVSYHAVGDCSSLEGLSTEEDDSDMPSETRKPNPFDVLAALKSSD
jgi:uncharacterized protein